MMYVAYRPCGCVQGFTIVDKAEQKKDAAKYVSMWVKDGWEIQTKDSDEELVWNCEQHKGETK